MIGSDALAITIEVADDVRDKVDRVSECRLRIHLRDMTVYDQIEVKLNSELLECATPMRPGAYCLYWKTLDWLEYDLRGHLPKRGLNELSLRMAKRNERLAEEFEITVQDIELLIRYEYPDGIWPESPRPW